MGNKSKNKCQTCDLSSWSLPWHWHIAGSCLWWTAAGWAGGGHFAVRVHFQFHVTDTTRWCVWGWVIQYWIVQWCDWLGVSGHIVTGFGQSISDVLSIRWWDYSLVVFLLDWMSAGCCLLEWDHFLDIDKGVSGQAVDAKQLPPTELFLIAHVVGAVEVSAMVVSFVYTVCKWTVTILYTVTQWKTFGGKRKTGSIGHFLTHIFESFLSKWFRRIKTVLITVAVYICTTTQNWYRKCRNQPFRRIKFVKFDQRLQFLVQEVHIYSR